MSTKASQFLKTIWSGLRATFEGKAQSLIPYIVFFFVFFIQSAWGQNPSSSAKMERKLKSIAHANKLVLKITDPWADHIFDWSEDMIVNAGKHEKLICSYETTDHDEIEEISRIINKSAMNFSTKPANLDIRAGIFFAIDNGTQIRFFIGEPFTNTGILDGTLDGSAFVVKKAFLYEIYLLANKIRKDERCENFAERYSDFLNSKE